MVLGTTKGGDSLLKTSSGDTLKYDPPKKTQKQEERLLEALKGQQIEAKGHLKKGKGKNETLKATSMVKTTKGKK